MLAKYNRFLQAGRALQARQSSHQVENDPQFRRNYSREGGGLADSVDTVVVGGGIVGVCTAYHLARRQREVLLLEKLEVTSGSTWHAAGLITAYHPSPNVKRVHWESLNFYNQITAETGQEIGFHRPGSLRLGTCPARMDEFRYTLSRQLHKQSPMQLLSADEVAELVPILNMEQIYGGLFTPNEGHIDPYSLTMAVARGARQRGARLEQNCAVTGLRLREDGGWEVDTQKGTVRANRVINCCGFHGREVGLMAGLDLPLVPVQHQYLVTKSVPEVQALSREIPVLRHLEGSFYLRQERDGLLIGPYESSESMVQMENWTRDGVPPEFGKELYPGDLERLAPHLEIAMEAFPCFANAEIQSVVNGPITYTPDILPMVGPTMVPNMWVAVGFGYGIVHGGGVGKYLADWICDGEAPYELIDFDPCRYNKWTTLDFTVAKTRESYGMNTALSFPHEERQAGRPTVRPRPLYSALVSAGAHMGFSAGWEVPLWFSAPGQSPAYQPSFFRTNWQEEQGREYSALMEGVVVADISPFGKFQLSGPDARRLLEVATAGVVPRPGRTSLSHLLTRSATVYGELTVTCLAPDSFLLLTGAGSELHDLRRLQDIARDEELQLQLENVTEKLGTLTVAGPKSGELMRKICDQEVDNWKFLEARHCTVGGVDCIAIRISYTGELGWELYPNMENMEKMYRDILDKGAEFDIGHIGTRCINTARIEKGFRAWGREMNKDVSPIEAGLMPFVKMKKEANFIGKSALLSRLESPVFREVVMLRVESPDCDPEGDETILSCGTAVGFTTSGCYSPATGSGLALANLPVNLAQPGTRLEVMLAGRARAASVLPGPPLLTQPARERREERRVRREEGTFTTKIQNT